MTGASLHLLRTVTAIVAAAPAGIYATYEEANRAAAQAAAKYLTATGERVEGVAVETSVVVGHPSMAVIEAAKAADLVVMASHGHSGFKRMLLGSVTDATIRGSGKLMLMGPHHKEWRRRPRRRSVREVRDPLRHRGTGEQGDRGRYSASTICRERRALLVFRGARKGVWSIPEWRAQLCDRLSGWLRDPMLRPTTGHYDGILPTPSPCRAVMG